MADITEPLQYGRLTGDFWAVIEDTIDAGEAPDTVPLMGSVLFTPSYRVLRVTSDDVTQRGVAYVDTVTAQVVNGVLVDDFGQPGVSLLAATDPAGMVFPHDIFWTATFDLTMASGEALTVQPEPTQVRMDPGITKSISDFVPTVLTTGSPVSVISVDLATLRAVDSQVDYINDLVDALGVAVADGVVKGDQGEQGEQGEKGEIGPYGPPGRSGTPEIYNYVKNPVPTSNEGYHATDGTVSYSNNELTLTANGSGTPKVTWVRAIPAYPGTNMYLQFDADTSSSSDIQSTITFLNAELEEVHSDTLVHSGIDDGTVPDEVVADTLGTYSHMSYTDGPASYAIFSVGLAGTVPSGDSVTLSKFFFSDSPGSYFSGSDTLSGYNLRWYGSPNDSYSIMVPVALFEGVTVASINGQQGDVVISPETLGLGSVDNTSDADKPISDLTQAALDEKLDIEDLTSEISVRDKPAPGLMALKEFNRFATQEVWRTAETFVDISHVIAPVGGSSLVRLSIPGSITGNSPSSVPTIERSADGESWSTWRTLFSSVPSGVKYNSIDGAYDRATATLKVLVREESTSGTVTLHLFSVDGDGAVEDNVIGTFPSSSKSYRYPSIIPTELNDGSLYMYHMNSSGVTRRSVIEADGTLSTTITNLSGLSSGSPAKVTRMYGTYVAASADGSAAGSPGILVSIDGITWKNKGVNSSHTWDRGANAGVMSAYPGVSSGRVGIFVEYVDTTNYRVSRIFVTSRPTLSGEITGVSTESLDTSTSGTSFEFPGTLPAPPRVIVSSNDSRLSLGVIAVDVDGGTIERFNMGEAPSDNATITWTAIE